MDNDLVGCPTHGFVSNFIKVTLENDELSSF